MRAAPRLCIDMARSPQVFDRAIKLRPKDASLLTGRARYHVERGEWKEAAADFARAIELSGRRRTIPTSMRRCS